MKYFDHEFKEVESSDRWNHAEFDCTRKLKGGKTCGATVSRFRGQSNTSCDECNAQYNPGGQRLRDDWRGNPSNYDSEIGDMEGYEMQHAGDN